MHGFSEEFLKMGRGGKTPHHPAHTIVIKTEYANSNNVSDGGDLHGECGDFSRAYVTAGRHGICCHLGGDGPSC